MTNVLLDTNVISAALSGDVAVGRQIDAALAVFIPFIAAAELQYGAYHANHPEAQRARVDAFVRRLPLLFPDAEMSDLFGRTKATLRAAGKLIPDHDIWIGALAVQHKLQVATRDAHFQNIDGLAVVRW